MLCYSAIDRLQTVPFTHEEKLFVKNSLARKGWGAKRMCLALIGRNDLLVL